jgi:hypothetical protein
MSYRETEQGYVYFMQAVRSEKMEENWIKIGYSAWPGHRAALLQTGCPYPLRIVQTIPGTRRTEQRTHRYFAKHKVQGEWYSPAPEILEVIHSGKFPFIEHSAVWATRHADGEVLYLRAGFRSPEDMQLLRDLLTSAESQNINAVEWLEQAIREKLKHDKKK